MLYDNVAAHDNVKPRLQQRGILTRLLQAKFFYQSLAMARTAKHYEQLRRRDDITRCQRQC